MRLTNVMMTNTTLLHINRNMRSLHHAENQRATGQKIQRPSDDPIIASRALMFRTSVHENEQFQENVRQGMAWMNVTESSFNNINKELLFEIRNLAVTGATMTNCISEMQVVVGQMRELYESLSEQMNQKFVGDYLFSGFRTNEPPVFSENNGRRFVITQHFGLMDISRESSFQRLVVPGNIGVPVPVSHNVNVLKLAYTGLEGDPIIPGFDVVRKSIDDSDAYLPPATNAGVPVMHFIHETGELVMHSETASNFPREGVSVTYTKEGFRKGEINPTVYFTGREINTTETAHIPTNTRMVYNVTQYFSRAAASHTDGNMTVFNLAFPPYNTSAADLQASLPRGAQIDFGTNTVRIPTQFFNTNSNVSVTYPVERRIDQLFNPAISPSDGLISSDSVHIMENPFVQGVELVRAIGMNGMSIPLDQIELNSAFNMRNQEIQYEFASNTRITINSLAKDVFTDKMFADFRRFFAFTDSLHISERRTELEQHFRALDPNASNASIKNDVDAQLNKENPTARDAFHQQFNNMLFLIDRHFDKSQREQTTLGARMVRMELVQNRLEEDEVSYKRLRSDNENIDLAYAEVIKMSANALFMASLRANSGVIQMSLANFLR
jgi:flagellin-like hook-associated protein FlgL